MHTRNFTMTLLTVTLLSLGGMACSNNGDNGNNGGAAGANNPNGYDFSATPSSEFIQVDRAGIHGNNLFINYFGDQEAYNQGTPADDGNGVFLAALELGLESMHLGSPGSQVAGNTGVDDDLISLALTPCLTPPFDMSNCDDQVLPWIMPDVAKIDLDEPTGYPNGRGLEAPVPDIIFALAWLDLGEEPITTFIDLDGNMVPGPSLNPLTNDESFLGEFPYLAPAH